MFGKTIRNGEAKFISFFLGGGGRQRANESRLMWSSNGKFQWKMPKFLHLGASAPLPFLVTPLAVRLGVTRTVERGGGGWWGQRSRPRPAKV